MAITTEGWFGEDELAVEALVRLGESRPSYVYTHGLWWMGVPELFLSPPASFVPGPEFDWARTTVLFAAGLMALGRDLVEAEGFELPAYRDVVHGQPVDLWLGPHLPPGGTLREALPDDVDTVIRVECSLWAMFY